LLFLLLNYSPFKNRFILDCASSADTELSIISLTPSSLSKAFISLVVFSSFEVMVIDVDGEFLGDPKGWQSREDINELIKLLS